VTAHAVETRRLTKAYRRVVALDGLDLEVESGSVFGFLGPNGAGKSTTIKLLVGLIRPSDGAATVLGHDAEHDGVAARRGVGYLPQQPRFHPYRTVRGVLTYVAHLRPDGPRGRTLRRRIDELLDAADLGGKARRRAGVLSGGERQRLGIAQALIADPELVILDEPAAGLDPQGRHDVLDLIERLRGRTTVFFSTHLLDDVQRVADTVGVLADGHLVAHGPLDRILSAPAAAYTVRLRGDTAPLRRRLDDAPWVAGVDAHQRGDEQLWEVQLAEEPAVDALVGAVVADGGLDVIELHATDPSLELAYLELVGAGR
jgi:ABC-2 type transport system ATP-binding protein